MDHEFHCGNIILSVTLRCSILGETSESFFIGCEDGTGQKFVSLRDVIFDPLKVFNHCA